MKEFLVTTLGEVKRPQTQYLNLWCFLNFWRIPLSMSVNCWRGGEPIEGERGGENRPFRGRKGQVFPACEPRKGHLGSAEAKGQGYSFMKMRMVRNSFQRAKWVLGNSPLTGKIAPLTQGGGENGD